MPILVLHGIRNWQSPLPRLRVIVIVKDEMEEVTEVDKFLVEGNLVPLNRSTIDYSPSSKSVLPPPSAPSSLSTRGLIQLLLI